MSRWVQQPTGTDKEIIEKYYCGVKIIMNERKILLDNEFTLKEIYSKIDEIATSLNMEKIDKSYYVPKNKIQSDLGKFIYNKLGIGAQDWFIYNVKNWYYLHQEDGIIELETEELLN